MKLTRSEVQDIAMTLNLNNYQKRKLIEKFCIPKSELVDKVYYKYEYMVKDGINPRGEGVITNAMYSKMKADHDKGKKKSYGNSEYITVYWAVCLRSTGKRLAL